MPLEESNPASETSRLTAKFQATIPASVRRALKLNKGDRIVFTIRGKDVLLQRATALDVEFAKAVSDSLTEWSSPADERAYADL
jgi:antitoxin PrlF